jgi:FtsP/CotA-like multicopper oxidase with cupredoxin domain
MPSTPESTRRRFLKGGIAIGAAFVATAPSPAALKKAYDSDNLFRLNPNITPAG